MKASMPILQNYTFSLEDWQTLRYKMILLKVNWNRSLYRQEQKLAICAVSEHTLKKESLSYKKAKFGRFTIGVTWDKNSSETQQLFPLTFLGLTAIMISPFFQCVLKGRCSSPLSSSRSFSGPTRTGPCLLILRPQSWTQYLRWGLTRGKWGAESLLSTCWSRFFWCSPGSN